MADLSNWAFPALDSMVLLRSEVPEDAFTAGILGTERIGNGVVIRDDGLVLTIGYLITEATTIWLNTNKGAAVAGHPLAYDQATGFGLVQPLGTLAAPALSRGTAASCRVGDDVVVAGHGGRKHALKAKLIADQRRRAAARHRLADGSGRIGRPHRAGQHDRTDRLARADP